MKSSNVIPFSVCVPLVMCILFMSFISCASVGRDFSSAKVPLITIGQTDKSDLVEMFGTPWRRGIEDGRETWTYGKYTYRLFGETSTKDLVIRFDKKGVVASYSFNTTEREIKK